MKTLITTLMLLIALPAGAESRTAHYSAGRGSQDLVAASRQLDAAAQRLHADLRQVAGRSQVTSQGRDLARATGELRRLAEQRARPARIHDAWRRVQAEHADVERRLLRADRLVSGYRHRGLLLGSLRDVNQGMRRTGTSVTRYAYAYRDHDRRDGRHDRDDGWRHPRLGAVAHDDGVRHVTH